MLDTFWTPCSHRFPLCWHHVFKHRFRINFISIWERMLVSILMFVDTLSARTRHLLNLQKTFVFTMNLNDFTIQKSMILNHFHDIGRYLFWHWLLMVCCIDFGSMMEPVCYHFPCFSAIDLLIIWGMVSYWFNAISDPKLEPKASTAGLAASGLHPRFSCTHKCDLKGFLISKFPSRFSCTLLNVAK